MWFGPKLLSCAGFWDGSCERGVCGAGMPVIKVSLRLWDGLQFTKSADQYLAGIPLMPSLGGCAILMDNVCQWIDKRMHERMVL